MKGVCEYMERYHLRAACRRGVLGRSVSLEQMYLVQRSVKKGMKRGTLLMLPVVIVLGMLSTLAAAGEPAEAVSRIVPQSRVTTVLHPGEITIGSGSQSATIYRDSLGIPHIYSSTTAGMWYGVGWAQAQDRLVQLELTRLSVEGNLSSVFGKSQLSTDEAQRLYFYNSAEIQQQYNDLPAATKAPLQDYANGVNAYITQAYSSTLSELKMVPYEFWMLGRAMGLSGPYRPSPWQPTDTLAIGIYLARAFGGGGGAELQNLAFINYLTAEFTKMGSANPAADAMAVFNDTSWINDPAAPTTVPATCPDGPILSSPSQSKPNTCLPAQPSSGSAYGSTAQSIGSTAQTTGSRAQVASVIRQEVAAVKPLLSLPSGSVLQAEQTLAHDKQLLLARGPTMKVLSHGGSNAIAVAPWRSADHHALLWGAPQEGFSTPSVDYEEYLHGPGYDASGMAIAGEPFILIGHNASIAWTTTSEETVNQGVFVEQVHFTGSPPVPSTYYFDGNWIPVQVVNESIAVAGSSTPVAYTIYRTVDGPIFSTDPAAGIAYSLDFTSWMQEYKSLIGFSQLGGDTNLQQFQSSMQEIVTLHNFMYADTRGNIAFFADGLVPASPSPLSARADPRLPHLGDGSQQWTSFVPFSQMPRSINPGQGYLDNWNTKPSQQLFYQQNRPAGGAYWGAIFRSQRISQMLAANTSINIGYLDQIQHDVGTIDGQDVVRPAALYFIPYLESAYQKLVAEGSSLVSVSTHPDLQQAMRVLETWNGHTTLGSPAMSIFIQYMEALERNVFEGGLNPGEKYVGGVNFSNASLGLGTYGGIRDFGTYNFMYNILSRASGLVPCNTLCYTGHYFGGHRDHIMVESLNDAITILSGTGPQFGHSANGFGTTNIASWGWEPSQNIDWNSLDPIASAAGLTVNCGTSAAQNRSTYFMAVDLAPVPFGYQLMPPGESGFISGMGVPSPYFCDQTSQFDNFQYLPMSSYSYVPLTASRICDTRLGNPSHLTGGELSNCAGKTLGARDTLAVRVAGLGGVPANAAAVAVNVTAIGTTASSYLSVYPAGSPRPLASTLNWGPGQTVAGLTTVVLPASGIIDLYNYAGSANVVVDVEGYYQPGSMPGGSFTPLAAPLRICDTSPGNPSHLSGTALANCSGKAAVPGVALSMQVTGVGSVPVSGVAAVLVNIGATNPGAAGYVSAYPAGSAVPVASNVNYSAHQSTSGAAIIPVGRNGAIDVLSSAGSPALTVDVEGWIAAPSSSVAGSSYNPIYPARICDTRSSSMVGYSTECSGHTLSGGKPLAVPLAGVNGISRSVTTVIATVTVTDTTSAGSLYAYPAGGVRPATAALSWGKGTTVSGLVVLEPSSLGATDLLVSSGTADVTVDVVGFYG